MKKICIITTIAATLRSFVVDTAEYLYKNCGYDITLISNGDEDFAKSLPPYLHYIPVKMERGVSLSGWKAIKELKKIFKREKFDLVQYSTPNAAFYASIASKAAKVPIRLYGQWGMRYVGFKGIKRQIFKMLEKITCNNSTHVFAVSPLNMKFAIQEKLYTAQKAEIVGNGGTIGVDCTLFDINKKAEWSHFIREKHQIKETDFVYGFVGRITADKGCKELFSAFRMLSIEKKNIKLLIVGPIDYNCELGNELMDWAKNAENVIFTGLIGKMEIPQYYASMDVLVHPTYREGFGMVIQEAGALAVPTLTTKIPGASEVMEEGVSCILVEAKSIQELKNEMLHLVENQEETQKLGQAARQRTVELYERQIMLANQKTAYDKLLS